MPQTASQRLRIYTSPYSVSETLDRLTNILTDKGVRIFARIDHAQAATGVDMDLADTQVLVFGDPKVGTFLMQEAPAIAIELPLKVAAWATDEGAQVAYTDMDKLAGPYQITQHQPIVEKIGQFMDAIVTAAISTNTK